MEDPRNRFKKFFFKIIDSSYYEGLMIIVTLVNVIVLGLDYEGMGDNYENDLGLLNDVFTCIFVAEFVFKLVGLGRQYFSDKWNIIDLFIVTLSLTEFFLGTFSKGNKNLEWAGHLAKGFRVIRIIRVVKLLRLK